MPSDTPTRPVPPVPRLTFTPDGMQEPHPILDVDPRALRAGFRTLPIREHLSATAAARRGWFAVWGPRGVATHTPIPHAVCPGCGCLVPVAPYPGDGHHPTAGEWSLELPAHMRRTAKSGAGWRACRGARVEGPGADPAVSPTTGKSDPAAQTDNLVRGIRRVEDELGDALNRARPALTWDTAIDNGRHPGVREGIAAALDTHAPGKGHQRREMYLRPRALLSAGYRAGGVVDVPTDGVAWELLCVGLGADAKVAHSPTRIPDTIARAIMGPATLQWKVCPALVSAVFHRESVVGINAGVTGRTGTDFPPVGPGAFTLPHVVTHSKMGLDGVPVDPADIGAVELYLHPLALEVVAVALRMALSPPPPSHHAAQALGWIEYRPESAAPWLYLTPFGEERLRACLAACLLALGVMPVDREYPVTATGPATTDYAARVEAAWAAVQLAPQDGCAVTRALGVVMAPWVAEVGDVAVARFRWRGMGDTSGVEYPAALGFEG